MAWLTDLDDAARKSGLKVVEVGGWKSRVHGGMNGKPKGVVCHWTATPDTSSPGTSYPSLRVVRDGRTGLPGPLANLGLGRDGTVYVIAAGLAYHAGSGYYSGIGSNGNYNLLGIEADEGGDGDWTEAMLDAYPRLCAALAKHYGFSVSKVIGHHEWAPGRKIDINSWPGGMAAFRARVRTLVNQVGSKTELDETPVWHLYEEFEMELPTGTHAKCGTIPPKARYLVIGSPHGDMEDVRVIFHGDGYPKSKASDGVPMFDWEGDVSKPVIHRMRPWRPRIPKRATGFTIYYTYPKPDNRYDTYAASVGFKW